MRKVDDVKAVLGIVTCVDEWIIDGNDPYILPIARSPQYQPTNTTETINPNTDRHPEVLSAVETRTTSATWCLNFAPNKGWAVPMFFAHYLCNSMLEGQRIGCKKNDAVFVVLLSVKQYLNTPSSSRSFRG